jgi:DNA-binding transcriptional LysR family regulator
MTPSAGPAPAPRPAISLPGLIAFECVARHMNFTRAATEMEVTTTAISRTVRQLEASLGIRLFNRTTRSVALTEAGLRLLGTLGPALDQIHRSVQEVGDFSGQPHGQLRINTSYVAHAALLQPHLLEFVRRYPDVTLDMVVDNGLSDIVAGGFDAGIRLGHALQKDMIGVPIGPLQRLVVVGSPAYLQAHGTPSTPEDLLQHECIRQRIGNRGQFLAWSFLIGDKRSTIEVQGRMTFSEMRCTLESACLGEGLAIVFEQFAAPALRDGRVVPLLQAYTQPTETFYLYYPNRGQMPGKLRALIQFLQAVNWAEPR